MKQRAFGETGFEVSEIVFGAGYTGGVLILADEASRQAALERAIKAGINWIDTAPHYGNGQSEETIGRYRDRLKPRPVVSTKVALAPDDLADIAGAVERSVEQSLKRLRCDRLDVLQLHNPLGTSLSGPIAWVPPEIVLRKAGIADALERIKNQGLAKVVGMTALGDARACIQVIESGRFESAQVYYNMINPSAAWDKASAGWSVDDFSGILPACRRHHVAAMCIRAFAGGALASAVRHGREAVIDKRSNQDEEERRAALAHAALGTAYGTPAQVALRFVLSSPDIACVVAGVGEASHIDDAVDASRLGPLPAEALARIDALCQSDYQRPKT